VADAAMLNGVISRSYDFEVMTAVVGNKQVPSHHSPTTCMSSEEEIVQKFRQQVAFSGFVSEPDADEIIRRVDVFEQETDVSRFVGMLSMKEGNGG
jgi:hypothetical protein